MLNPVNIILIHTYKDFLLKISTVKHFSLLLQPRLKNKRGYLL
jgi:hypothetical protein